MAEYKTKNIRIEAIKYKLQEWGDNPFSFDELPDWLVKACKEGRIKPEFGNRDYWYLIVISKGNTETYCFPDDYIVFDGYDIFVVANGLFKFIFEHKFDSLTPPPLDLSKAHEIVNSLPKWKQDLADKVLKPNGNCES